MWLDVLVIWTVLFFVFMTLARVMNVQGGPFFVTFFSAFSAAVWVAGVAFIIATL